MAAKSVIKNIEIQSKFKKTSIGKRKNSIKFSSMNKSKKRTFKSYRGQGK